MVSTITPTPAIDKIFSSDSGIKVKLNNSNDASIKKIIRNFLNMSSVLFAK
jgi:hypothetical protein